MGPTIIKNQIVWFEHHVPFKKEKKKKKCNLINASNHYNTLIINGTIVKIVD